MKRGDVIVDGTRRAGKNLSEQAGDPGLVYDKHSCPRHRRRSSLGCFAGVQRGDVCRAVGGQRKRGSFTKARMSRTSIDSTGRIHLGNPTATIWPSATFTGYKRP